jgi:hypothetical protein
MTVARKLQNASGPNAKEQLRVRAAIRHLHTRVGDWVLVAKSLGFAPHVPPSVLIPSAFHQR